jgi:Fic family protein
VLAHRREDAGVYRRVPVRIAGALTEPVQPYLILPRIEALLSDTVEKYSTLHIVEKVALFHLHFENIHPFIDGNGRTGRLLMNLQLIQSGYPPINVKFTDRRRYYEAFDSFSRTGQADNMTTLVAEYLKERLQTMIDIQKGEK